MDNEKMQRVSKANPCPICGRCDWCLISPDKTAAICPRTPEGAVKEIPDSGYLHILADRPKKQQHCSQRGFAVRLNDKPDRDFTALQQQYSRQMTSQQVNTISEQLGVSEQSLRRLNIGWDGQAYTFPMSNAQGQIIGIRRRFPKGNKVSVKGSKTGLFIPKDLAKSEPLFITEGPTDTGAALDLGFDAIGRPNCNSKIDMTVEFCKGRSEIIVVGDNDKVGREGAEKLAGVLVLHCHSVKIIYPPDKIKDLRQWLRSGLTSETLQRIIQNTKVIQINISFKD